MRKINKIVIHCSATGPNVDVGFREINRWHLERGFIPTTSSPAIGYHKVIRRDGSIEQGRPEERVGAHAAGHNANSLGVCLVGGVKSDNKTPDDNFTAAQYASLTKVLIDWREAYGAVEIVGHGSLPGVAKACPSFDVKAFLKSNNLT